MVKRKILTSVSSRRRVAYFRQPERPDMTDQLGLRSVGVHYQFILNVHDSSIISILKA